MGTPGGIFHALRHRDFRLLWAGQTISLIGDGLFKVTITWQALELSSSASALALITIARSIPRLAFLLIGGAVSDRIPRRKLMLIADTVQMVGVGAIAVLVATGEVQLWHLASLSALIGLAQAFYLPSITAITPELVPREDLVQASALRSGSQMLAYDFIGPAIGGVLVAALGTAPSFGINAASFAASVVALLAIRRRPTPALTQDRDLRRDLMEGLGYVRSQRWLWISLVVVGISNLAFSSALSILIPLHVKTNLGGGPSELGAYFAAIGLGGGIAVLTTAGMRSGQKHVPASFSAWGISALAITGAGLSPWIAGVVVCGLAIGAGLQYGNVMWESLLQSAVPGRLLGRVTSFDWFVSLALEPLGLGIAAPIATVIGAAPALVAAGVMCMALLTVGYTRKGVRRADPVAAAEAVADRTRSLETPP